MAKATSRTGLGRYLKRIGSAPLLSSGQAAALARRVREHGDPIARERLILCNLRLVVNIAGEFSSPYMTLGDLIDEGSVGLVLAVDHFDPDAGARFRTYATLWVRHAIKRAATRAGQFVHVSDRMIKSVARWRRAAGELQARLGRAPGTDEIAGELRISRERAKDIQQAIVHVAGATLSREQVGYASESRIGEGNNLPVDVLVETEDRENILALVGKLPWPDKTIVELRYGLGESRGVQWSLNRIAEALGMPPRHAAWVYARALRKLRKLMGKSPRL